MIARRRVLLASGIGVLMASQFARGQPAAAMRRVGWVSLGSKDSPAEAYVAFKPAMRDLGWQEKTNIEYRAIYADGDVDRLATLATDMIGQGIDVIVVGNATATRVLQRATKVVPIVMASVNNPVGNGFVTSLAKPGGNITGTATHQEEVLGKLIEILHEITPGVRRIAIMVNDSSPNHAVFWAAAQRACSVLGIVALRIVANTPAEFDTAVEQIVRQRSQAVVVVPDPVYLNERVRLQTLMRATFLPVAYGWREHVVAGGLVSYAPDLVASVRDAAKYVDKILKGAKPADLPVQQSDKFDLVINLSTAKSLGLTIPQTLRMQAELIQ